MYTRKNSDVCPNMYGLPLILNAADAARDARCLCKSITCIYVCTVRIQYIIVTTFQITSIKINNTSSVIIFIIHL